MAVAITKNTQNAQNGTSFEGQVGLRFNNRDRGTSEETRWSQAILRAVAGLWLAVELGYGCLRAATDVSSGQNS